jgi:hypothetical protein
MSSYSIKVGKPFVWTLFTYLFLAAFAAPASFASCDGAIRADLGAGFRSIGLETAQVFEVEVPASGVLAVEAIVPVGAAAQPKLALLDHECRVAEAAEKGRLETFIAGRVLEVRFPGVYRFAVAPQDPSAPLGSYRLETRFASWADLCGGGFPALKTHQEPEREPDLAGFCLSESRGPWKSQSEPEREPDLVARILDQLCRSAGEDDHADHLGCATRLAFGAGVTGRLANAWGDDADVFRFFLVRRRTVAIEVETTGDVVVGLYDGSGHRLALAGDSPPRHVLTLAAGVYHLRLESAIGAESAYHLGVTAAGW